VFSVVWDREETFDADFDKYIHITYLPRLIVGTSKTLFTSAFQNASDIKNVGIDSDTTMTEKR